MRVLTSAVLLICVAIPAAAQSEAPSKPAKIKRQPNLITMEEIDQIRTEVTDAADIVKRLRPQFLRSRGANSFGNSASGSAMPSLKVVVDGSPMGDIAMLSQIPASNVREIRYLNSSDATIQFGTGYDGGAILVTTR